MSSHIYRIKNDRLSVLGLRLSSDQFSSICSFCILGTFLCHISLSSSSINSISWSWSQSFSLKLSKVEHTFNLIVKSSTGAAEGWRHRWGDPHYMTGYGSWHQYWGQCRIIIKKRKYFCFSSRESESQLPTWRLSVSCGKIQCHTSLLILPSPSLSLV